MFRRKASSSNLKKNVFKYRPRNQTKRRAPSSRRQSRGKQLDSQANEYKTELEKQSINQEERYKSALDKESKNITERNNRIEVNRLEAGDLVEFKNGVGVYLGDETVALLTRDKPKTISEEVSSKSSSYSCNQDSSEVHLHDIFVVAGDNKVERNNLLDEELIPLPRSEIMMRVADCLCDADSLNFKSSEDFVKWCRYGDTPTTRNGSSTLKPFNPFNFFFPFSY